MEEVEEPTTAQAIQNKYRKQHFKQEQRPAMAYGKPVAPPKPVGPEGKAKEATETFAKQQRTKEAAPRRIQRAKAGGLGTTPPLDLNVELKAKTKAVAARYKQLEEEHPMAVIGSEVALAMANPVLSAGIDSKDLARAWAAVERGEPWAVPLTVLAGLGLASNAVPVFGPLAKGAFKGVWSVAKNAPREVRTAAKVAQDLGKTGRTLPLVTALEGPLRIAPDLLKPGTVEDLRRLGTKGGEAARRGIVKGADEVTPDVDLLEGGEDLLPPSSKEYESPFRDATSIKEEATKKAFANSREGRFQEWRGKTEQAAQERPHLGLNQGSPYAFHKGEWLDDKGVVAALDKMKAEKIALDEYFDDSFKTLSGRTARDNWPRDGVLLPTHIRREIERLQAKHKKLTESAEWQNMTADERHTAFLRFESKKDTFYKIAAESEHEMYLKREEVEKAIEKLQSDWYSIRWRADQGLSTKVGEPTVFFHGSKKAGHTTMKTGSDIQQQTDPGWFGAGIYLSNNPWEAQGYSTTGIGPKNLFEEAGYAQQPIDVWKKQNITYEDDPATLQQQIEIKQKQIARVKDNGKADVFDNEFSETARALDRLNGQIQELQMWKQTPEELQKRLEAVQKRNYALQDTTTSSTFPPGAADGDGMLAEEFTLMRVLRDKLLQEAEGGRPGVYAFHVRMENPFEWHKRGLGYFVQQWKELEYRNASEGMGYSIEEMVQRLKKNAPLPKEIEDKVHELTVLAGDTPIDWDNGDLSRAVTEHLADLGYDSVVRIRDGAPKEWMVFNSNQLKAVANPGTYSKDPDTMKSIAPYLVPAEAGRRYLQQDEEGDEI